MSSSLSQLQHKKRNISDLARHLENRTDNEPNYILFLGAGASTTSGIRSGSKLVEVWKKEVFNSENIIDKTMDEWLESQSSWYDDANEYSSLFEKRFDLPAQRRNFIEGEVSNKIPFIGYAYLVEMVNKNFINTVMTTNFDDLLSEAFYIYGNNNGNETYSSLYRPIVCAHDSTINSININSKRPKIIKLHGDYLYDNIKSSLRETESLETNIKNKLIELSKNKGLIVVGYAGSDRSIMDTLNFLLSNEDYLKHGVYWCIRKGDSPSKNLEKLLWKDKVYFVEIDGYDELMAELNYRINNGQLNIENHNFLKKRLLDEKNFSNDYIKKDVENLLLQRESKIYTDFFETLNVQSADTRDNSKKSTNKLKIEEEVFLLQERKKLRNDNEATINEVIKNCQIKIEDDKNNISNDFRIEILELISRCYELKDDYKEALKKIIEIEEIEPHNTKYFQRKIRLIDTYDEKIKECNRNIEIDNYNYIPYVQKVLIKLNNFKNNGKRASEIERDGIEKDLKKAIELEPGKHNMAYYIYIDFILDYKIFNTNNSNSIIPNANQNNNNYIPKAKEVLKAIKNQDPYEPELIKSSIEIMNKENKSKKDIKEYIENKIKDAPVFKKEEIYTILFNFYFKENMKEDVKELIKEVENKEIYKSDEETFIKNKANIEFKYNKNIKEAIKLYRDNEKNLNNELLRELAELYLYNNDLEEAKDLIFNIIKTSFVLKRDYLIRISDFDSALEELEKWLIKNKTRKLDYIRHKSFILLHAKRYQEALDFFNENAVEKIEDTEEIRDILYNLEFTKKKLGKGINWKKIEKFEKETSYEIAYHFLNDDHKKAVSLIKAFIDKDFSHKYMLSEWCYFKDHKEYEFLFK